MERERVSLENVHRQLLRLVPPLYVSLIHADDLAEEERLYHQLVVDTHIFLVRKVERRLLLVDSDSSEG